MRKKDLLGKIAALALRNIGKLCFVFADACERIPEMIEEETKE